MAMSFVSTLDLTRQRLHEYIRAESAVQERGKRAIGRVLVQRVRQHYELLSTVSSSEGITWPQPSAKSVAARRRLRARGRMAAGVSPEMRGRLSDNTYESLRYRRGNGFVSVYFARGTAANLMAGRGMPIMPRDVPQSWLADCDSALQKVLDRSARRLAD